MQHQKLFADKRSERLNDLALIIKFYTKLQLGVIFMMKEMTDHYKIKNNYWGFFKSEPIFSNIKREDVRFSTGKNKEIKSSKLTK